MRRATAEGLPVLAITASGGTRMQEGTPAFVEMVEISWARHRGHRRRERVALAVGTPRARA